MPIFFVSPGAHRMEADATRGCSTWAASSSPGRLPAGVELGPYHALANLEHSPSRHPFVAEHDRLPQAIDQGRQPNGEVIGVTLAELAGRLAALDMRA